MKRQGAILCLLFLMPSGASADEACRTVPFEAQSSTPPGWSLSADATHLVAGGPSGGTVSILKDYIAADTRSVGIPGSDFGYSVSIDEDWMVVGAPANGSGSAYIVFNDEEPQPLSAPDLRPGDRFGASVSIAGDWLVVGAPDRNTRSGAAFLFKRSGSGWVFERELRATDGHPYDTFGASVAVSDDGTVVVGAPYADDPRALSNFGAAYVFEAGTQKARLVADETFRKGDIQFGSAVAIEDSLIAVGAPGDDIAGKDGAGSAYLFIRNGADWSSNPRRVALVPTGGPAEGRQLGASVDIEGGVVAVGAPFEKAGEGSAWLFDTNGTQRKECRSCPGLGLGRSVAIWKDTVFLGGRSAVAGCFGIPPVKPEPDLVCEFEAPPTSAVAGGTVSYTILVHNEGDAPAESAQLKVETLPVLGAGVCDPEGCSSRIPVGGSRRFHVAFSLPPTCDSPESIQPRASIRVGTRETTCSVPPATRIERRGVHATFELEADAVVEGSPFAYHIRLANGGPGVLKDGPRSELIHTTSPNLESWEVMTGGGELYYSSPSGFPLRDLHWNGVIPRCGEVDIRVTAIAESAGTICLDAEITGLDGRVRTTAPYCFQVAQP